VSNHGRTAGVIDVEARCKTLRVQIPHQVGPDHWEWHDADRVWLVSNPSESAAIREHADGTGSLLEDVALLRVEPAPSSFISLDPRRVQLGDRVWMVGFPLRTARSAAALIHLGYSDADGSLRVSSGEVTAVDNDEYFSTNCDGSMGNSGSPVLNESGQVVGIFSRGTGDGSKNAFAYGHVTRVQVSSRLTIRSLSLENGLSPHG
jgi:S1-C subfamily serine protease